MSRFILCLLFMVFAVRPVFAAETVPVTFVAPLMQWVADRVAVPISALPIVYISHARMVEKMGNPQRQSALARALYVPNEVVIDDEFWDAHDTRTISFLVHELVHHAQYVSGRPYVCNNAKEWEAYKLQNQWLAEHGLPPAVEESWINQMASCGR
jgi:hypothetical protein